MYIGLPAIVTDCRGNRDLIDHNLGGYVVGIDNYNSISNYCEKFLSNECPKDEIAAYNKQKSNKYLLPVVLKKMFSIYERL
jgi:glycosyltransferase EpsD